MQGIARAQEQVPIKPQTNSCLDTATILQLLQQQQQHESQVQGSAEQAGRVSVGCQTRQGDTWRVHSEACLGKPAEESGSWAQHGNAVTMTCIIIVVTVMMMVAVMLSFTSIPLLLSLRSPTALSTLLSLSLPLPLPASSLWLLLFFLHWANALSRAQLSVQCTLYAMPTSDGFIRMPCLCTAA